MREHRQAVESKGHLEIGSQVESAVCKPSSIMLQARNYTIRYPPLASFSNTFSHKSRYTKPRAGPDSNPLPPISSQTPPCLVSEHQLHATQCVSSSSRVLTPLRPPERFSSAPVASARRPPNLRPLFQKVSSCCPPRSSPSSPCPYPSFRRRH